VAEVDRTHLAARVPLDKGPPPKGAAREASRKQIVTPTDAGGGGEMANGCEGFVPFPTKRKHADLGTWVEVAWGAHDTTEDVLVRARASLYRAAWRRAWLNQVNRSMGWNARAEEAASRLEPVRRCLMATWDVRGRKVSVQAPPAVKNGARGQHPRRRGPEP
jgi:hypothetical protein